MGTWVPCKNLPLPLTREQEDAGKVAILVHGSGDRNLKGSTAGLHGGRFGNDHVRCNIISWRGSTSLQALSLLLLRRNLNQPEAPVLQQPGLLVVSPRWVRREMDQTYDPQVIAAVIALGVAVALVVRIARGVRRRLQAFSRTMTFLS